jgi:hypothetical protein
MKNDGVTDLTVGSNHSSSDLKICFIEEITNDRHYRHTVIACGNVVRSKGFCDYLIGSSP